MESVYERAANSFYSSFSPEIQRLIQQSTLRLNTAYCILEIRTDSANVAEDFGIKRDILNHKLWSVFPQHWQLRIILDRCYCRENVVLWSSEDKAYLIAAHDKQPVLSLGQ